MELLFLLTFKVKCWQGESQWDEGQKCDLFWIFFVYTYGEVGGSSWKAAMPEISLANDSWNCKSKKAEPVSVCDVGCSPSVCCFCQCFVLVGSVTQWPLGWEYIVRAVKEKIKIECVFSKRLWETTRTCVEKGNPVCLGYVDQIWFAPYKTTFSFQT